MALLNGLRDDPTLEDNIVQTIVSAARTAAALG